MGLEPSKDDVGWGISLEKYEGKGVSNDKQVGWIPYLLCSSLKSICRGSRITESKRHLKIDIINVNVHDFVEV